MSHLITAESISHGWVAAMEFLIQQHGTASNLIVSILPEGVGREVAEVRGMFDALLLRHKDRRVRCIGKVADTIFPIDLYRGGPGKDSRERFYRNRNRAASIEKRTNPRGKYIDRLINWRWSGDPEDESDPNQLERLISRMKKRYASGTRTWNAYELAVAVPVESANPDGGYAGGGDLRIQDPLHDRGEIGFPCLSHISLTLSKGRLDMTALYRNQHFMTKAYGNLVGLSHLLRFIAQEVGCEMGELVCVATHADAELGENGIPRQEIIDLVRNCRTALSTQ